MSSPTTAKGRFLKLAGMTASIAGKAVKSSLTTLTGSEDDKLKARTELMQTVGLQIADTLGEMKGAVMKVGQIASQYKDVFPPEVAKALKKLQKDAPPMPYPIIKAQVEKELSKPINELFQKFEETPFAAASIGQVHKAVLPNGEVVVVKVQYPDVDKNCDSDLRQVRMALKIAGVLNMDKTLQDQIFDEIRNSLYDELDYTKEAQNLAIFADFHKDDDGLIIPTVHASHSSKRILTLSQELGETLETASTWDNDTKQKIAARLFHFSAGQLFKLYRLHCDPHPGNFAFCPDGSVIAYDFGGIKSYSYDEVELFREFAEHALQGNTGALDRDLIRIGVRKDLESGKKGDDKSLAVIPAEFYQKWLEIGLAPYGFTHVQPHNFDLSQHVPYDFATSQIHHQAIANARDSLKYWQSFQPSPLTMMLDRTISGQYWNLVNLGVKVDLAPLVAQYVALTSSPP